MKSGYRLLWSDNALRELRQTFNYLEENFTDREIRRLASKLELTLRLIQNNPTTFPVSSKLVGIRRAVVTRHNKLYYRISGKQVEILSFFNSRQDPNSLSF